MAVCVHVCESVCDLSQSLTVYSTCGEVVPRTIIALVLLLTCVLCFYLSLSLLNPSPNPTCNTTVLCAQGVATWRRTCSWRGQG